MGAILHHPIREGPGSEHLPCRPPTPRPIWHVLRYAAYGVLATVVGLAAAHLVAAFTVPAASPAPAVVSTVIDLTPTRSAEFAIRQFGTADKLVLVGSVTVVVLLLAALAGVIARRRETVGSSMIGAGARRHRRRARRPPSGFRAAGRRTPVLVAAVAASTSLWVAAPRRSTRTRTQPSHGGDGSGPTPTPGRAGHRRTRRGRRDHGRWAAG